MAKRPMAIALDMIQTLTLDVDSARLRVRPLGGSFDA
jgi:hypothetical protein